MPSIAVIIDAIRAKKGARDAESAFRQVKSAATESGKTVDGFNSRLDKVNKTTSNVVGTLKRLALGFGAVVGARAAIQTIIGFEQTIATLRGVTNATDEDMQRLSRTAREFGATTRFSAREAGEGLLFLARTGFTVQQSMDAIGATLDLAAASGMELGRAADVSSNIVKQFGLATTETDRVVDSLVNTSNSANTTVAQLAEAFTKAGTVFATAGNEVEDTASAIGVLGDRGIQASEAGTQLRAVMASLLGPSTEAKQVIKDLGLTLDEVNPEKTGIIAIFQKFAESGLTLSEALQIFDRRAAAAAITLAEDIDKFRELADSNREAEGAAKSMANVMESTLGGSLRSLKSTIEEFFLVSGEEGGLAGALKDVVDTITDGLRVILGMEDKLKGTRDAAENAAFAIRGIGAALLFVMGVKFISWAGRALALLVKLGAALGSFGSLAVGAGIAVAGLISTIDTARLKGAELLPPDQLTPLGLPQGFNPSDLTPSQVEDVFKFLEESRKQKQAQSGIKKFEDLVAKAKDEFELLDLMHQNPELVPDKILGDIRKGLLERDERRLVEAEQAIRELPGFQPGARRDVIDRGRREFGLGANMDVLVEKFGRRGTERSRIADDARELVGVQRALNEELRIFSRVTFDFVSSGIGDALFDVFITKGAQARDILKGLALDLGRFATQLLVRAGLTAGISAIPGGSEFLGLAGIPGFSGQRGLDMTVNRPTTVLVGEGGEPERVKVTPLSKVGATEGGINVTMNVFTRDADSYRRSESQILGSLRRRIGRAPL